MFSKEIIKTEEVVERLCTFRKMVGQRFDEILAAITNLKKQENSADLTNHSDENIDYLNGVLTGLMDANWFLDVVFDGWDLYGLSEEELAEIEEDIAKLKTELL